MRMHVYKTWCHELVRRIERLNGGSLGEVRRNSSDATPAYRDV
jgi:hypothetical protein